jgi:galactokinase
MKSFGDIFGGEPEAQAAAPGRVNLLGEHTDYNDGYVLPTAIPQKTRVALRRARGAQFTLYSAELDQTSSFALHSPPAAQFARYVYGCIAEARARGAQIPPLDIHVQSQVPIGIGLSSSAALEVATLRALRELLRLDLDDVEVARLAQRAEVEHAGVNCGILDQMASSLLEPGAMLFLDTRSLERRLLPLPAGAEVLVIDSGQSRSLASSKYNERRSECEAAARALGKSTLRDVTDIAAVDGLPVLPRKRARHVISENARVLRAIESSSPEAFGKLMNESHASLRDDYEVSTPVLDTLQQLLQADPAVFGAKLTGAGFGGACVALCQHGESLPAAGRVLEQYDGMGHKGRLLVPA